MLLAKIRAASCWTRRPLFSKAATTERLSFRESPPKVISWKPSDREIPRHRCPQREKDYPKKTSPFSINGFYPEPPGPKTKLQTPLCLELHDAAREKLMRKIGNGGRLFLSQNLRSPYRPSRPRELIRWIVLLTTTLPSRESKAATKLRNANSFAE
jgi:hypothetical protein